MHIPITKAVFDETEMEAIIQPLKTGWVVQGPYVKQFEQDFVHFTKTSYAKAVSNCTTALHLALEALGVGAGDKVVVPSFTYVASANAVEYTGAEVVFCDVELDTFNIDPVKLEQILQNESGIKAVMPVNLFGLCADLNKINELKQKYNFFVVEDSACGFDSWLDGKHSGTFGDIGCFSFHPRKSITTGEGGMLTTDDEQLYTKLTQLCDHGASKSDLQRHQEHGGSLLPEFKIRGYNYRMTDFQGALGVSQMSKANWIMNKRRGVASQYDEALSKFSWLKRPSVSEGYIHGYQSYVCLFTLGNNLAELTKDKIDAINVKRNLFMQELEKRGIATRQGTHAVHTLTYYKNRYNLHDEQFLNSYISDRLSITLPLYAEMTPVEFDYVIQEMNKAYECVV
ncbi:DegT/DnrJ/EryC1/StrS family aminotransferase [Legionella shakespearei]|uniref:AHBA synthase n=1 Tax=Legionella shakespearei DSM 23087 TaxID=1122169 RepID=A0A0W0YV20_9GAMM|nr:DegT/DnrJ/EryC1/StrS family aminotransferase [Legionella shakespearei]KTD60729.1 AHBA synthase [Legionella shakespearei DSM 23087]